ncbi:hypothetical protein HUG17_2731 [Dermatophagoides farinae]|uniref:Protein YIPF n=1 Tax=Dermatophagoides farinae TaxID=6954 RepID=A0A9D4NUT3_DERFA|nr:protein YIPF1-like [Dermatophagoides farinae]KAH7638698.1 hypothetical protein HUG17_2731 [Dermatophagoides farinae]
MDSNNKPTDSAILFLDSAFEPKQPSTNQQQPMDGHQILNQVQLQFIPTGNENLYVTGQIQNAQQQQQQQQETTRSYVMEPSVIVTGSNQQQKTRDTDFLVDNDDTQPIDLGSPVRSHDGTTGNGNHKKLTIWQFDYYARYFDITTDQFFRRIIWSLVPLTMGNEKGTYIDRYIHSNPDLYGPFWIPLTLAFTISFCDDIIRYMNINSITSATTTTITPIGIDSTTMNKTLIPSPPRPPPPHHHPLAFEFERINMAMTITFSYVILAPLILWSFCQWRRCSKLYTFIECLCAYGYSLSLFVPVTILALINNRQIQFIFFASAAFLSGSVLLISFGPVVHSDPSRSFKFAYVMLIFILISHIVLALFYLYMFL